MTIVVQFKVGLPCEVDELNDGSVWVVFTALMSRLCDELIPFQGSKEVMGRSVAVDITKPHFAWSTPHRHGLLLLGIR